MLAPWKKKKTRKNPWWWSPSLVLVLPARKETKVETEEVEAKLMKDGYLAENAKLEATVALLQAEVREANRRAGLAEERCRELEGTLGACKGTFEALDAILSCDPSSTTHLVAHRVVSNALESK